ncbi:MAG TPA: hypothetical protein VG942_04685 [Hyphomonadaceae bacterium]|nr:hypothetical protein [Hyphomonadaceae bacterium]
MKQVVLLAFAALLAGCAGVVEWGGLSGDEHRAYTRSDSACDASTGSHDPACYEPRSDKQQH